MHGIEFTSSERFTVCPEVNAAGTPDRTCTCPIPDPDGVVDDRVWDLKTGTLEYGGLKMATQLAIYAHSQFYNPAVFDAPPYAPSVTKRADPDGFAAHKAWRSWCETEFEPALTETAYSPIPPVNQKWGLILNLPVGTASAELHWVDLELGWEAAQLAVVVRKMRSMKSTALTPLSVSNL
jgi:hypothetical protein